jgi:hypothetical protein
LSFPAKKSVSALIDDNKICKDKKCHLCKENALFRINGTRNL